MLLLVANHQHLGPGPYLEKYFARWEVDVNIYYRYRKLFKVNFYVVVHAILTLFGINIAMLVKCFFLCHCYRCLVVH